MLIELETPFFSALLYYDNIIKLVRAIFERGTDSCVGTGLWTRFSYDHSVVVW